MLNNEKSSTINIHIWIDNIKRSYGNIMKLLIKKFFLKLVLVGFVAQAAMPSIDTYGKLESVSNMSISPNGELIAYRLTKSDKEDFVVVRSLTEKKLL